LNPTELSDLCNFVERFAAQRAKEEKSGKVTQVLAAEGYDSDEEGGGVDQADLYDFM
jgi:hypothetical protein